jgi:hypothetical protein
MTIKGTLTDSATGKPVPGATFEVFYGGNLTGPPDGTFMSQSDGSYTYVNGSLDTAPNPAIAVTAPGYLQLVGDPNYFYGTTTIDPEQIIQFKTPVWVIIALVILSIVGFIYFNKKYKLLK